MEVRSSFILDLTEFFVHGFIPWKIWKDLASASFLWALALALTPACLVNTLSYLIAKLYTFSHSLTIFYKLSSDRQAWSSWNLTSVFWFGWTASRSMFLYQFLLPNFFGTWGNWGSGFVNLNVQGCLLGLTSLTCKSREPQWTTGCKWKGVTTWLPKGRT